jgi:hypothetical protein
MNQVQTSYQQLPGLLNLQADEVGHTVTPGQALPYADDGLDYLIVDDAGAGLDDMQAFLHECRRVLRATGRIGLRVTLVPEQARAARYCNAFEQLRDPARPPDYSLPDWEFFLSMAALSVERIVRIVDEQQVGRWAYAAGCDAATIYRLRAMLLLAPSTIRTWYGVEAMPGTPLPVDITFQRQQALILAHSQETSK